MRWRYALLALLACAGSVSATEFCDDLNARYPGKIMRCVDFAGANDAAVNATNPFTGVQYISTALFDSGISATPGATGALHWRIKSYDTVKAENPGYTNGQAWRVAKDSDTPAWRRWIGVDQLTPGQTYWYQFKVRFNDAYKVSWGGTVPKVFGLDAGCRTVNGVLIPNPCEVYTGTKVTGMETATSMETATITTANFYDASVTGAANRPYWVAYQGGTDWEATQNFTNLVAPSARLQQTGVDSGWVWNSGPKTFSNTCDDVSRLANPDYVLNGGPCITKGAANVWHQFQIELRPSGHFYDWNPIVRGSAYSYTVSLYDVTTGAAVSNPTIAEGDFQISKDGGAYVNLTNTPTASGTTVTISLTAAEMSAEKVLIKGVDQTSPKAWRDYGPRTIYTALAGNKIYRHDTLLKIWYDGQLMFDYDPDETPLAGQLTNAECAALQTLRPDFRTCRTGIDLLKHSNNRPPFSNYAIYSQYGVANDPGADLTQLILWTFSYRRGYPMTGAAWCASEIGVGNPFYAECASLASSDVTQLAFDAFLHHDPVDVFMDDVVVSTVPMPMQKRPDGARVQASTSTADTAQARYRSFGLDARDLGALPPNTWTRLFPGPDRTIHNTQYGTMPGDDVYSPTPGTPVTYTSVYTGVAKYSSTNYLHEVNVSLGVPVTRAFNGVTGGTNGDLFYFGGGHSNLHSNRVDVWDHDTGRWTESTYTPELGSGQVIGGAGPRMPTPPGVGCTLEPYVHSTDPGGPTNYFTGRTGNTHLGTKIVDGISSTWRMCPIKGVCTNATGGNDGANGGYVIKGTGIPAGAVIYAVLNDSTLAVCGNDAACAAASHTIQMTHNATATATGVALEGGSATCTGYTWNGSSYDAVAGSGTTNNGATGGKPWWEHMGERSAYDPRAGGWMINQVSGTWLYDDATLAWKHLTNYWPTGTSSMCGADDYNRMVLRFSPAQNKMLLWCTTDKIYGFDYGTGAPNFTGAQWVQLHQLAVGDRNLYTASTASGVWEPVSGKFYYLTVRTNVSSSDVWNPEIAWYDPVSNTSGKLLNTRTNYPQSYSGTACQTVICQQITASIDADGAGNLYVVGRRATDAQILLWKVSNPTGPNEAWTVLDTFNYNTYDNAGLKLYTSSTTADLAHEFNISAHGAGMLHYLPQSDVFLLLTRHGQTDSGGGTRGLDSATSGGCWLNGVADDCFRMYAIKLDNTFTPPSPGVDTTPPTVSITSPSGGADVTGTTSVTASASDDVGVARVDFTINGTPVGSDSTAPYTFSFDASAYTPGTDLTLQTRAYDAANNATSSSPVVVHVPVATDLVPPTLAITSPLSNTYVATGAVVPIEATASDNVGVREVQFFINNTLVATDTAWPYAYAWDTTAYTKRTVRIEVRAIDTAGNLTRKGTVVYVLPTPDTTAPVVQVTSPTAGANVASTAVTTDVLAADTAGIARVELYINGEQVGSRVTGPWRFSWNTAGWAGKDASLVARAYDPAGNYSDSTPVVVHAGAPDHTAPTVTISDPTDLAAVYGNVPVAVSASDDVAVDHVNLYVNSALVGTLRSPPYRFRFDSTPLAGQSVTLQAQAFDAAGNVGEATVAVSAIVTPDTTPPRVAITSPTLGSTITGGGTVNVTVSASDNVGVEHVALFVNGVQSGASKFTPPYTFTFNAASYPQQTIELTARAYDTTGNIGRAIGTVRLAAAETQQRLATLYRLDDYRRVRSSTRAFLTGTGP